MKGLLAFIGGCSIAAILITLVFKLDWNSKEHILIVGYGGLASVSVLIYTTSSSMKKREMDEINDKFKEKADVKDIEKIECQIGLINENVKNVADGQEKAHNTIGEIYKLLLNSKLGGN